MIFFYLVGGDTEYFITLQIGTPPTAINFVADTGSADLWMATKPCLSGCVAQTPLYDPKSSSSSKVSSNGFMIQYGSGEATGLVASDKISIGGLPSVTQVRKTNLKQNNLKTNCRREISNQVSYFLF